MFRLHHFRFTNMPAWQTAVSHGLIWRDAHVVNKEDEGRIKKALFDELCKTHPDDVVIFEWKGTWVQRKGSKAQSRPFDKPFDVARLRRVMDESASPIL